MGKILLGSHHRKVGILLGASTADENRSCWDNLSVEGFHTSQGNTDHVHGRLGNGNRYQDNNLGCRHCHVPFRHLQRL